MKQYSVPAIALIAGGCASVGSSGDSAVDFGQVKPDQIPQEWSVSLPSPAESSDWITQFQSSAMENLISEALASNPSLIASRARANAAYATSRGSRADRLPTVSGDLTGGYNTFGDDLGQEDTEAYGLGLTTSWEMDIWGQVGKRIRAADADFAASESEWNALRLSIAGQTANAWVTLSNQRAQLALAEDELAARARARELTERRVGEGLATTLDVRLSRSAEASAESAIANADLNVKDAARNLEVLLGRYPTAEINAPEAPPALGAMADEASPADLLARRPDVAAAEARMVAAGLRADLARIAMRPALSLTVTGDINSDRFEDLLDVDKLMGRALASLTAPIFNGGRLANEAKAARENAKAAAADYAGIVLAAWQEVEGARNADLSLKAQENALLVALEEAQAAETLAERQYQRGLISIFNLIDAQTRRINAESQLIAARAQRAINRINYHLALGGGNTPSLNAPTGS